MKNKSVLSIECVTNVPSYLSNRTIIYIYCLLLEMRVQTICSMYIYMCIPKGLFVSWEGVPLAPDQVHRIHPLPRRRGQGGARGHQ